MAEDKVSPSNLSFQFEDFAERFFRHYDIVTEREVRVPFNQRAQKLDLLLTSKTGAQAAVEVKLYRTLNAPKNSVRRAIEQLLAGARAANLTNKILLTNSRIDSEIRSYALLADKNLVIYDYDLLKDFCLGFPTLSDEFDRICRAAFEYLNTPITPDDEHTEKVEFLGEKRQATPTAINTTPPPQIGKNLCMKLRGTKKGRGQPAREYELLCEEILKYAFDDHLTAWKPQKKSKTNLHRFDLIARIASDHDFWNALISDYRSRYIIFEFKNYTKKITQSEVYSTEKYLMPLAMRGMAIILARMGADKNANAVMAGALRDGGKLMMCLTDDDLCEMLHLRDSGDDATRVLTHKLDEILQELER